jgi:hypothetical protein
LTEEMRGDVRRLCDAHLIAALTLAKLPIIRVTELLRPFGGKQLVQLIEKTEHHCDRVLVQK